MHHDVPVTLLAKATGASRQTVYNWFNGGEVLQPYKAAVTSLVNIMKAAVSTEDARRKICQAFSLPH